MLGSYYSQMPDVALRYHPTIGNGTIKIISGSVTLP